MILKLDADARARVFERDGSVCIRCHDATRAVQWCHVLSRRDVGLRWELDNAMTLCAGCHMFWHHEPAMAVDWLMKKFPEQWARLMAMKQVSPKVNIRERFAELAAEGKRPCQ